jgi:ribosome-binding protein aMBF1 (putative translation factor)
MSNVPNISKLSRFAEALGIKLKERKKNATLQETKLQSL